MLEALCRGVVLLASQTGMDGDIDPLAGIFSAEFSFPLFPLGSGSLPSSYAWSWE